MLQTAAALAGGKSRPSTHAAGMQAGASQCCRATALNQTAPGTGIRRRVISSAMAQPSNTHNNRMKCQTKRHTLAGQRLTPQPSWRHISRAARLATGRSAPRPPPWLPAAAAPAAGAAGPAALRCAAAAAAAPAPAQPSAYVHKKSQGARRRSRHAGVVQACTMAAVANMNQLDVVTCSKFYIEVLPSTAPI